MLLNDRLRAVRIIPDMLPAAAGLATGAPAALVTNDVALLLVYSVGER